MSRVEGFAQSRWLADAREEIAAALRTSDECWLQDMSIRWGCRLAMLVADFGVRVMLHEEGIVMRVDLPSNAASAAPDPSFGFGGSMADSLARAAWIKLAKFEEHAIAVLEASALIDGDAQCDACHDTILAWRQMLHAANEWPREEADAFISHASRPILRQFMNLASCATGGQQFELARKGDYEEAWFEFEHFCANPRALPATAWGRKYRNRQGSEAVRRPANRQPIPRPYEIAETRPAA